MTCLLKFLNPRKNAASMMAFPCRHGAAARFDHLSCGTTCIVEVPTSLFIFARAVQRKHTREFARKKTKRKNCVTILTPMYNLPLPIAQKKPKEILIEASEV
ncbi:unnamed protein product [Amoebophrya sp. A120]|nr:unnamed protein product [Amoebophrya sp. A120]|eukprot:GSA120T00015756001.1